MRIAHKPHGKPYAYGSTLAWVKKAHAANFGGVDVDLTLDKAGKGYWNHWGQPMLKDAWRDPLRVMNHRKGIRSMSSAEARRLKSPYGSIMSIEWAIASLRRYGLRPFVEAKSDPRLQTAAWWIAFRRRVNKPGHPLPVVMTLPGAGNKPGIRKMKAAHAAKLPTMWLARGPVPPAVLPYLTFVKRGNKITRVNPDPR